MTVTIPADHRPRAFWADLRFLLGVLLVLASIAGVWFVVTAARHTIPVIAVTRTLVPGEPITDADVQVVEVALGTAADTYVGEAQLGESAVALRTLQAGELLPVSAVGDTRSVTTTTIVLSSSVAVPAAVKAGARVEVWYASPLEHGEYDRPEVLIADATVVDVTRDDSLLSADAASLELAIPRADVASVLAAIADNAALSVVPLAGAVT